QRILQDLAVNHRKPDRWSSGSYNTLSRRAVSLLVSAATPHARNQAWNIPLILGKSLRRRPASQGLAPDLYSHRQSTHSSAVKRPPYGIVISNGIVINIEAVALVNPFFRPDVQLEQLLRGKLFFGLE